MKSEINQISDDSLGETLSPSIIYKYKFAQLLTNLTSIGFGLWVIYKVQNMSLQQEYVLKILDLTISGNDVALISLASIASGMAVNRVLANYYKSYESGARGAISLTYNEFKGFLNFMTISFITSSIIIESLRLVSVGNQFIK